MRRFTVLMAATALSACSGGGAQSIASGGSTAPGGSGSGTGTGSSSVPARYTDFTNLAGEHTYTGIAGSQTYSYVVRHTGPGQSGQLYAGNATTASNSNATISYSARDGIYTLTTTDNLSSSAISDNRFQDPAHRINYDLGIPTFSPADNIRYVGSGSGSGTPYEDGGSFTETTLFYQVPGTNTRYVSFAGFQRISVATAQVTDANGVTSHLEDTVHLDRGAFAYGVPTDASAIPTTGTGTYDGAMLASMVNTPGNATGDPSYFQWIYGTARTTLDFGTNTATLALNGTVSTALYDQASPHGALFIPDGSSFAANATGTIATGFTHGFSGSFTDATFSNGGTTIEHLTPPTSVTEVVNNRVLPEIVLAASTFDGSFYGPKGEEVGGDFRIVGGTPDQRVDIVGAFTGKHN